jgi:uncharacterized protein (TIGR02118 family)
MVRITVLYPNKPGSQFDIEYYLNTHMPMSAKLLGPAVKNISVDIGRPTPGSDAPAPFAAIATFTCDTVEDFVEAFTPVAGELQGDIPKYTNIEPVIQFGDIRIG